MTGNICWDHNYKKHKQLLLSSEHSIVSGNPLLNELNLSEKQAKWFSLFLPFKRCYACTSTKINFYPTNCLSNEKHSNGDKTMDYLANYPCSIESVSQIEKQLWHKLRNIESQSSFGKDSTGPKNKKQNFSAHFHNIDVAYI